MLATVALLLNSSTLLAAQAPVHTGRPIAVEVVNRCGTDLDASVAEGDRVVKPVILPAETTVVVELGARRGLRIELLHGTAVYRSTGDPDRRRRLVVRASCDEISSTAPI